MALSDAVREGIWLKGFCEEMKLSDESIEVHCDSQSAIYLAKNYIYRAKTKHIATKYNFIRMSSQVELLVWLRFTHQLIRLIC